MRKKAILLSLLAFSLSGCSGSDTLPILLRDSSALMGEAADTMMGVVDESSADYYLKIHAPRFNKRGKKLADRIDMWSKYADEEVKKLILDFKAISEKAGKAKEFDPAAFEELTMGTTLGRLSREIKDNEDRFNREQNRIKDIVRKLEDKGPALTKMEDAFQATFGGKAPGLR